MIAMSVTEKRDEGLLLESFFLFAISRLHVSSLFWNDASALPNPLLHATDRTEVLLVWIWGQSQMKGLHIQIISVMKVWIFFGGRAKNGGASRIVGGVWSRKKGGGVGIGKENKQREILEEGSVCSK